MGLYESHVLPHLINLAMRSPDLIPYRKRVLSRANGRVLEIGLGSGLNLPFYTHEATEIFGLDPHPKLLAMARGRNWRTAVTAFKGSAEFIPFDDCTVDTVVMTWTLCSIPDAPRALGEVRRVLKPARQLLFVEHGMAPEPGVQLWQRRLTPAWKRFTGGCHLDRPVETLVRESGFEIASLETGYMKGPKALTFMYEGRALPM